MASNHSGSPSLVEVKSKLIKADRSTKSPLLKVLINGWAERFSACSRNLASYTNFFNLASESSMDRQVVIQSMYQFIYWHPHISDGAVNPPVMYLSLQQINDVWEYWKHLIPTIPIEGPPTIAPVPPPAPAPPPSPAPPPPAFPALLLPTPECPTLLLPTPTPHSTGAPRGPHYRQLESQPSGMECGHLLNHFLLSQ